MQKQPIAIGRDDFKEIREKNSFYVDKTKFISEIIKNPAQVKLFTRPRRFGKSLNMSMLKYFFDIENKDENRKLFKGLYIENSECMSEQGQYPVILISFKDIKGNSWEEMKVMIGNVITRLFRENFHLTQSLDEFVKDDFINICRRNFKDGLLITSLQFLSESMKKYYNKNVIILIDEYDTPIISAYQNGYYKEAINFFKTMYGMTLKGNTNMEFGVMTGIVRIAQTGIFSDLNNLDVYTIMRKDYEEFFGFTEKEVRESLLQYDKLNELRDVKYWYNGYNFGNIEIYNPWSISNYLKNDEFKAYWVNTSSNDMIIKILRKSTPSTIKTLENLLDDKKAIGKITENVKLTGALSENELWEFLLFAGYTKVVNRLENNLYTFKLPNHEVKTMFKSLFLDIVFNNQTSINELTFGLISKNIEKVKKAIENLLLYATSYWDLNNSIENRYQLLLSGFLYGLEGNFIVHINRESGDGRADIVLEPINSKTGYIFELKLKSNKEDPILQINEKRYDAELKRKGIKDIVKLGMIFDGKKVEFVE